MNKIGLITIYFGEIPNYFNLFLQSAAKNKDFDFIIFTEQNTLPFISDNIFPIKLFLDEFNKIAISKGILQKPVEHPYKLCDLKPAWFHILEDFDFLSNYEFLGYIDIDMILGKLNNFINCDRLKELDLWTISNVLISGALTIFRNSEKMKMLYRKSECWQLIFNYPQTLAFDEKLHMCQMKEIEGIKLSSFTDIVNEERKRGLNVIQENNIIYEWYNKTVNYKDGIIIDLQGREYISYHYVKVKRHLLWYYPDWKFLPDCFFINKYGFSSKRIGVLDLFKILIIPSYFYNAVKKIRPYFPRLFYHLFHTNFNSIITTIKDRL